MNSSMNSSNSSMNPSILLLSGPNLNLLGTREPELYGKDKIEDYVQVAENAASKHGFSIEHHQSASESEIVSLIHSARGTHSAIVINAGAFTHYAWSIHDALKIFDGVVVELHVTNPLARDDWRHTSVIAPAAQGTVAGFGLVGYELAVEGAIRLLHAKA